jgi:hypothetical protein
MKKQFGLPLMLASALAFSACSSDDVAENGNGSLTDFTNGGYVKMAINMPTVKSSEGAFKGKNDDYQDGTSDEYAVNNTTVILFQGNNENDAIFHSAYNITKSWNLATTPNGQISSTLQLTKKVNEAAIGSNLYALVVVNNNGLLSVGTDHKLTVNGGNFTGNFTDFKNELATAADVSSTKLSGAGLFMANAPLSKGIGGTAESGGPVTTLVNLTANVYPTDTEANNNPAAHIYIERGVAKVTFVNPKKDAKFTTDAFSNGKGVVPVTYTMDGWNLDITNTKSYLVRHVKSSWNAYQTDINPTTGAIANPFRFVGHTAVKDDLYRTYWAEDPNYSSTPAAAFNKVAGVDDINKEFGSDKPLYCLENTFDVANQNQDATTRAIVRVKVKINGTEGDFYTVNGGKTTLYSQENLDNLVKNAIITNSDVKAANGGTAPNAADITLTYSTTPNTDGEVKVEGIDLTLAGGTALSADAVKYNAILTAVNNTVKNITKYVGGYVYYPVRIKHFGDELTPWAQAYDSDITTGVIYPATKKEERYLGRYGVVRNNWYELEVNKIKGIGYAVIPPSNKVPDDVLDQYISVKINILSWARRKQSEEL